MVGMLSGWRWKGEKGEKKRKKFGNRSYTIPKQHEGRKYNMYTDTHIIQVHMYRDTNIPEISTSTFPPRYHTNPSIRYTRHTTLLLHLHLVSSIIIIPYNNTDKPGR